MCWNNVKEEKGNLTLAMSPRCQSNRPLPILLFMNHMILQICVKFMLSRNYSCNTLRYEFNSSLNFCHRQTDGRKGAKWCIWAHHASCTGGLKNATDHWQEAHSVTEIVIFICVFVASGMELVPCHTVEPNYLQTKHHKRDIWPNDAKSTGGLKKFFFSFFSPATWSVQMNFFYSVSSISVKNNLKYVQ